MLRRNRVKFSAFISTKKTTGPTRNHTQRCMTGAPPAIAQEAMAALVALGMMFSDADKAVRNVLENGGAASTEELIRKALAKR